MTSRSWRRGVGQIVVLWLLVSICVTGAVYFVREEEVPVVRSCGFQLPEFLSSMQIISSALIGGDVVVTGAA